MKELFSGKYVAKYIRDITPLEEDVPESWISKYVLPNNNWELKEVRIADLLESDKDFAEYINHVLSIPDYHRYTFSVSDGFYISDLGNQVYAEIGPDDIFNNPIVVYKGTVLDGYSRSYEHLLLGEEFIFAFIIE